MRILKCLFTRLINLPVRIAEIIVPIPMPFNLPKKQKDRMHAIIIKVTSK